VFTMNSGMGGCEVGGTAIAGGSAGMGSSKVEGAPSIGGSVGVVYIMNRDLGGGGDGSDGEGEAFWDMLAEVE